MESVDPHMHNKQKLVGQAIFINAKSCVKTSYGVIVLRVERTLSISEGGPCHTVSNIDYENSPMSFLGTPVIIS